MLTRGSRNIMLVSKNVRVGTTACVVSQLTSCSALDHLQKKRKRLLKISKNNQFFYQKTKISKNYHFYQIYLIPDTKELFLLYNLIIQKKQRMIKGKKIEDSNLSVKGGVRLDQNNKIKFKSNIQAKYLKEKESNLDAKETIKLNHQNEKSLSNKCLKTEKMNKLVNRDSKITRKESQKFLLDNNKTKKQQTLKSKIQTINKKKQSIPKDIKRQGRIQKIEQKMSMTNNLQQCQYNQDSFEQDSFEKQRNCLPEPHALQPLIIIQQSQNNFKTQANPLEKFHVYIQSSSQEQLQEDFSFKRQAMALSEKDDEQNSQNSQQNKNSYTQAEQLQLNMMIFEGQAEDLLALQYLRV